VIHAIDNHSWYNPPNLGHETKFRERLRRGYIFLCHELGFENQILAPSPGLHDVLLVIQTFLFTNY